MIFLSSSGCSERRFHNASSESTPSWKQTGFIIRKILLPFITTIIVRKDTDSFLYPFLLIIVNVCLFSCFQDEVKQLFHVSDAFYLLHVLFNNFPESTFVWTNTAEVFITHRFNVSTDRCIANTYSLS